MNLSRKILSSKTPDEVAAFWVRAEERGLSHRQQVERDRWLAADPAHMQAYRAAHHALDLVQHFAAAPELLELRQAALNSRPAPGVFPIHLLAACLATIICLGAGAFAAFVLRVPFENQQAQHYATEIGQRHAVTLPDGSVMTLNTDSAADVAYDPSERAIRLLRGQALFTVAHGQKAPFRVYAGDHVVTATGTRFDVRFEPGLTRVALVEGVIKVRPYHWLPLPLPWDEEDTLHPGQVLVSDGKTLRIDTGNVANLISWRDGFATFDDAVLSDAIREINRYTPTPIILADEAAGRFRVSGTFRTGDPKRFAKTMTELFPLEIKPSEDGTTVLASRPSRPLRNKNFM